MATIAKTTNEQLERIKKNIATSYLYFQNNYKRYREFRNYVFHESVSPQQRAMLQQTGKPVVEFNILEAYISRLLGEFSKHEPSITITPSEGIPVPEQTIQVVEGHLRHIMYEADKNSFSYEIYKDLLSGGFSVAKVSTDYENPMSFNQKITHQRVFDPTLCGFDPLARASHKGDGHYAFELYPYLKDDFERLFPDVDTSDIDYMRNIEGFSWSYESSEYQDVILVADYFEKKVKKTKIVKLANGRVMTLKNYEKLAKLWEEEQYIEQLPVVVGKPRTTELTTICNYKLIDNQIIEYAETDYTFLPLVFIDGNSIILSQGTGNNSYQMTRPYVYHAKGIQDLKNYAGQSLANHLENIIQHKFIVKKEAIPQEKDYLEALTDIQRQNTVVVNAYSENNPDKPIPEPIREVQNLPAPPEVMGAFQVTDPTTQTILGSYASNLGQNDNDLSGKAVIESATVGNAAAMPYVVGYLAGLTQIANIEVDLMPKYIVGKRTLPTLDKAKERQYQEVNNGKNPYINYEERALKVNIEAGVNFQVQKNQALQQILQMMQASQEFAAFMNDDDSLPILLDNLTIYGSDRLKEAAPKWIQKKQQMQQKQEQMQQQAMQMNPMILRAQVDEKKVKVQAMEIQGKEEHMKVQEQLDIAKLAIENKLADAKILEAEAKISQAQIDSAVQLEKAQTSIETHALDSAAKMAEIQNRHHDRELKVHENHRENIKLAHEISKGEKEHETEIQSID